MATGEHQTPVKVKRTYVLEPDIDEGGNIVRQRGRAEEIVLDLLGALWSVGGSLRVVADRVKVGELPPDGEPLAETVGLVIEYMANTPLNTESVTLSLIEQSNESGDADRELEPEVPAAAEPEREEPAAPAETAYDEGDDGSGIPVED